MYKLGPILKKGFGALVLAREGRPYCAELAAILDSAAAAEDGVVFTEALRKRIVLHFGTCRTCDSCATCAELRRRLVAPLAPVLIPILVLATTRDRIEQSVERVSRSTPLPPTPPGPRPRHRSPALLILPLLVVIAVVAGVIAATRGPAVLPVSLAGTWQLEPFNEPGSIPSQQNPQWSFTGACESADDCSFSWLPLLSTTTFESEFTPDFRESAKQQVPAGLPQNIAADLLVRPVTPGGFYAGKATAQYGIFDEQNQTFATGQETVILTIQVLDSTTEGGRQVATWLAVSVDFAAHDLIHAASSFADGSHSKTCGRASPARRRGQGEATAPSEDGPLEQMRPESPTRRAGPGSSFSPTR